MEIVCVCVCVRKCNEKIVFRCYDMTHDRERVKSRFVPDILLPRGSAVFIINFISITFALLPRRLKTIPFRYSFIKKIIIISIRYLRRADTVRVVRVIDRGEIRTTRWKS